MPGRTFFPNLSNLITFEAAPLVLTPFVRNQSVERKVGEAETQVWEGRKEEDSERYVGEWRRKEIEREERERYVGEEEERERYVGEEEERG